MVTPTWTKPQLTEHSAKPLAYANPYANSSAQPQLTEITRTPYDRATCRGDAA